MTTTVLAYIPSPSQGVWHLFGVLPIRAYALCIIAGIVAALVIGDRRWEARGGERGVIYDVALWAVPFGLIGGRLYHVMTDWPKYFGADGAGFLAALRIWDGGLGIWGAVALGGVGAWIACRRRGIPLPAFGDAIAPGIVLAQAIGRFGNYFNQELYGRETDLPWGLTIYDRLDPSGVISPHSLDGVSTGQVYAIVHPTFLYELLWNLLIFAVLLWADRRFKLGHGRLFALYVAGYCVGRFWVELMRSDTATLIAGIRVNTFTSTFVFIGAVIYIMVAPKGREDPASLRGKDADGSLVDEIGEELVAVAATSGVVAAAKAAGDEDKKESADSSGPSSSFEFTGGADTESEAAAETEDLVEQVENAPSEDIAEAEAFAEAGEEAEEQREAGLGSVEGDEAVEAELGAVEAHEAAVEGAASAAETAEAVEANAAPEDESTAAPEDGLGSVDGGEVQAAQADVAEVHDAAVEGTESAEAAAEATNTDESTAAPADGLGSVDGEEVEAAQADAAEVHDAAVEGTESAEAAAADTTNAEESTAAPEDGLGSVDGDEVEAAQADAAEVHDAAVEGTESAEATAEAAAEKPATPALAPSKTPKRRWWKRT
ncbi:prolipoprotein diacylglyceryl transferase [Mycobacterium sp. NPDC006124]|uniref:prolipoprotein diacylglyceryl transferase n=1 Tax=Mycobacterium sp. NPDC006124 TaxID=3156729 RepID=UPI0033B139EA